MQNAGYIKYTNGGTNITKVVPNPKFVGGDISLLTKYKTNETTYLDNNSKSISDMLSYLKQQDETYYV